jgi:hypothetical protein
MMLVLLLGSDAGAKTTLDIQTGLDDRFRVGRWSPVFLTVQSDRPRTVIVELRVPNASASAMTIRQAIGVSTQPQKYVMYAPLGVYYDPLRATVFDADSGKPLARWPEREGENIDRGGQQIGFMVMTAGRSPLLQNFRRDSTPGSTIVSHVRYPLLPASAIGYDSADVVYLNNPDWSQLSVDQQRALIDWSRAGGTIILYPGAETLPADAPLVAELPCTLGTADATTISDAQRRSLRLPDRFTSIATRQLINRPGARTIWLPESIASMSVRSIGLGRIAVISTDLGQLTFSDELQGQMFYNRALTGLLGSAPGDSSADFGFDADILAANAALDRIGNIPNTGGFGFSYIALVVGGLMFIVGPIDWLILKKIGKQPWTWATTIGWIGVFTCGALYAGHLLRSGDLHFRTLRLVDQAGDRLVAADDIALIYAPRSADYAIKADATTWWQPVPSGNRYNVSAITTPVHTNQTYRGNTPGPMWIDVWNWRFLRGSKYLDQPPLVRAKLKYDPKTFLLSGTITNLGKHPLQGVEIGTTKAMPTAVAQRIEAGATIEVSTTLGRKPEEDQNRNYYRRYQGSDTSYSSVFALSGARTTAVEQLEASGQLVLYATIDNPDSDISITDPTAITQHNALLRAVVEPVR